MPIKQKDLIKLGTKVITKDKYSVEFFHIYTDEKIGLAQLKSLEYLKIVKNVWNIESKLVILIDNYNPTEHITTAKEIIDFLESSGSKPDYWAYEADFVEASKKLLGAINSPKLLKSYTSYIKNHNKYPCSLLTATWYLTRLGVFDTAPITSTSDSTESYQPVDRLINILPASYRPIELRVIELIKGSDFKQYADKIQDLFYDAETKRKIDLF